MAFDPVNDGDKAASGKRSVKVQSTEKNCPFKCKIIEEFIAKSIKEDEERERALLERIKRA